MRNSNNIWVQAYVTVANLNQTLPIRVRDLNSGNQCLSSMTVKDLLPPALTCDSIVLNCAVKDYLPEDLKKIGVPFAYPVVKENCGTVKYQYADEWVDLPCGIFQGQNYSGYVRRNWIVTDGSNNRSTCVQLLYFKRIKLAEVKFPMDATLSCDSVTLNPDLLGRPYVRIMERNFPIVANASSCELSASFTDEKIAFCGGSGTILRRWTLFDWCMPTGAGNPVYHLQSIRIEDRGAPKITCPANLTVSTNTTDCTRDLDLPDVVLEDGCSGIKNIFAEWTPPSPDELPPVAVRLFGRLSNFPANNPAKRDTLGVMGIANDLPLGPTTIRYVVSDDCGNTASCSFLVTVEDEVPPVAICDRNRTISLGGDGTALLAAAAFNTGSTDNCRQIYIRGRRDDSSACQTNQLLFEQLRFCCADIGKTIPVTIRVYDRRPAADSVQLDTLSGHFNECAVQVQVKDLLPPECKPPANVTVNCAIFDASLKSYGMATGKDNCCVDTITATNNYARFDTLCKRGTIARTFQVRDCHGQSATCSQQIEVKYEQEYFVRFPDDVLVTACNAKREYGKPVVFGEGCAQMAISSTDQTVNSVPGACYQIERTWRVINLCTYDINRPCTAVPNPQPTADFADKINLAGPIVSASGTTDLWAPTVARITASDATATNFSTFWSKTSNCYEYKQLIRVADRELPVIANCSTAPREVCDQTANDTTLWRDPVLPGRHDRCETPVSLCVTASDSCSGANLTIRYQLWLDLNADGQMETVVNSAALPSAGTVMFNNASDPAFKGGTTLTFDRRAVGIGQKYRFVLAQATEGAVRTACLKWAPADNPAAAIDPELPEGRHKIKWFVGDGCGNERICEDIFTVKDCKKPSIACANGLSVNISENQAATLRVRDFVLYAADNCTPTDSIRLSMRLSGGGTNFPTGADGQPVTQLAFGCPQVGRQEVDLWAQDQAGNSDFCKGFVVVKDNAGTCAPPVMAGVAGIIRIGKDSTSKGLSGVTLQITSALPLMNKIVRTDTAGRYRLDSLLANRSYTVKPVKKDNPLNGVTTFDLTLIVQHILGVKPITDPYKLIAADANRSGSITTFDIVELRRLILGAYDTLPNNDSWRFVRRDHVFTNPDNPFRDKWPETFETGQLPANGLPNADFVAIKIGDVNGTAVSAGAQADEVHSMKALNVPGGMTNGADLRPKVNLPDTMPVETQFKNDMNAEKVPVQEKRVKRGGLFGRWKRVPKFG